MNLGVTCKSCNKAFQVNQTNLTKQKFKKNGQSIWLTYYDCPFCGFRHFVQVDDKWTNEMLKKATKKMRQLMFKRNKNMKVSNKETELFKVMRTNLDEARKKLENQLVGEDFYDERTCKYFKLEIEHEKIKVEM